MPADPLRPLKPEQFDYWKAQHLLNRAGFGGTPSQVRALANMGLRDAVDHLLEYQRVPFRAVDADEFDRNIMRPRTQDERAEVRRARQSGDESAVERFRQERQRRQRADRQQVRRLRDWWLRRMIETPRPLEEKMTLFWHGHFATSYRTIEDSYHMFMQNQLFRSHAVGDVKRLTHGVVHDPAMLRYLNNNQNRRQQPNENLARELMELFTLGEGNVYTERDIKEGARALTGYTYDDDEFVFQQRQHDDGSKRILGRSGNWDGDDFVEIIFTRDECRQFLCYKLYRFFVNDLPAGSDKETEAYILKLSRVLERTDNSIGAVLRAIFMSEHFYAPRNVCAQIKSPIQLIIQAIRTLRLPTRSLSALTEASDLMGQNLLFPPSVKGWDGGRAWINTATLFVRQNIMVYLLTGRRPDAYPWEADGSRYDGLHLIEHLQDESGDVAVEEAVIYLLRFTLGTEPHPQRVATFVQFVDDHGGRIDNSVLIALLSLIAAMPEYQLC